MKPTKPFDSGSPGQPTNAEIIAEQEAKYGSWSDAKLYAEITNRFAEYADRMHESVQRQGGHREALNDAYRATGEIRVMIEVIARRWIARGSTSNRDDPEAPA